MYRKEINRRERVRLRRKKTPEEEEETKEVEEIDTRIKRGR